MQKTLTSLLILLCFLSGAVFAVNVINCKNLSVQNTAYDLTKNINASGGICINITQPNITFDCHGFNITGDNSSSGDVTTTYAGVYTLASRSTIKNCQISSFEYGIEVDNGANNALVQNNTIYIGDTPFVQWDVRTGIHLDSVSNSSAINNSIFGIGISDPSFNGFIILGDGQIYYNNTVADNYVYVPSHVIGGGYGIWSHNNGLFRGTVRNNTIVADYPLSFAQSTDTLVELNSITPTFASPAINFEDYEPQGNYTVRNNTLNASISGGTGIYTSIYTANSSFYYNNITAGIWINNKNETNYFNISNAGNIYYFANGTGAWQVFNILGVDSNWAQAGSSLPFNSSTIAGNWSGYGQDAHPYTEQMNSPPSIISISISPASPNFNSTLICNISVQDNEQTNLTLNYTWMKNGAGYLSNPANVSNASSSLFNLTLNSSVTSSGDNWSCSAFAGDGYNSSSANTSNIVQIVNSTPAIISNLSFSNATSGHWFYANASASDANGAGDISHILANISSGSCTQISNSSSGNNLSVSFNCSSSSPANASLNITFIDSYNESGYTNTAANPYPDQPPSLSAPSISPSSPDTSSALACNAGAYSDADGDSENISARLSLWYKNGAQIAGANSSTLSPSNFAQGDNITCSQNSTNSTWSANAIANSSQVSISAAPSPSQTPRRTQTSSTGGGSSSGFAYYPRPPPINPSPPPPQNENQGKGQNSNENSQGAKGSGENGQGSGAGGTNSNAGPKENPQQGQPKTNLVQNLGIASCAYTSESNCYENGTQAQTSANSGMQTLAYGALVSEFTIVFGSFLVTAFLLIGRRKRKEKE